MPSASRFAVFRFQWLISCHFTFSFLPAGCSCLPQSVPKPHLLAGALIFTDRSPCSWGLPRPPRPVSKTYPDPPQSGLPYPFNLSHLESTASQDNELGFLLPPSLQRITTPSLCTRACLNTPSMTKSAEAETSKTS